MFKGLNIPKTALDHASLFIERSKQMNSICEMYKIEFHRFLQPTLGYGNYVYDLSDPSDKLFKQISEHNDSYHAVDKLRKYYSRIISETQNNRYPFLHDITDLFDGKSKLFKDFRHPNKIGYEIIAERIVEIICK